MSDRFSVDGYSDVCEEFGFTVLDRGKAYCLVPTREFALALASFLNATDGAPEQANVARDAGPVVVLARGFAGEVPR